LDRDAALAWQARQNATCGGCGTVRSDWLNARDPETGALAADELHPAYLTTDVFCAGCAARARHEATEEGATRAPGVHVGFEPNPDAAVLPEDENEV
jgi:hypothetical protein